MATQEEPADGVDPSDRGVGYLLRQSTVAALDPSRLRLDVLLTELVDRAQELLQTQGRLRALLDAVVSISGDLSLSAMLERIVSAGCELVDAKYGALGVLSADGDGLSDFITVGLSADEISAIGDLPAGRGILGALIDDPHPLNLVDLTRDARSHGFPPNHPPMSTFLGVPIRTRGQVFGNLYLTEKRDGRPFSQEDEYLVVALASAAGVAIQNAQLYGMQQESQRHRERIAVLEDRDRIARDLHDLVIQRLFAAGMTLQSTLPMVTDQTATGRIIGVADDLDATIRELRQAIYRLQAPAVVDDFRREVQDLIDRSCEGAAAQVRLHFAGPVGTMVPDSLRPHLLAVIREAVSNALRHASASTIDVSAAVEDEQVSVVVTDDGVGIAPSQGRRSGLANLAARAEEFGGHLRVVPGERGSGTRLEWTVPVRLDD